MKNDKCKILCLIPARQGSKGIIDKNIKEFRGKPLIAWSIEQAKSSKYYGFGNLRIVVSTDSKRYGEIAKSYGAEVPFLRPSEISQDLSTDQEFIEHALNWLSKNEDYKPDIILQLRPTQPLRKVSTIDKCLEKFIKNFDNYDSLRTVVKFNKSPYKMYHIKSDQDSETHILEPLYKEINGIKEPYNQCRQVLPKTFLHNGYIDIIKASIVKKGTISGEKILPFIMDETDTIDIDSMSDWNKAESNNFDM